MLKSLVLFLRLLIIPIVLTIADESCTTPDGQTSKCTLLADCPKLLDLTWSEEPEDRSYYLNSRCNKTVSNDNETTIAKPCEVKLTERIPENLTAGSRIIISGTPSADYPRIVVHIGNGVENDHNGNISIHFSIRKPEQIVFRNTMVNNAWGTQETSSWKAFPFRDGQPFEMEIWLEQTQLFCAVNGSLYFTYEYRDPSPLSSNWVQVEGLKNGSLQIIRKPDWFSNSIPDVERDSSEVQVYKSLVNTFKYGIKPGTIITCNGTAPDEFSWFTIGFGSYGMIHESFKVDMSEQSVIHSTKYDEEWGNGIFNPVKLFPFKPNREFMIQIKLLTSEVELLINGQHYTSYGHSRFSLYDMNQVFIIGLGNVTLTVENLHQDQKTAPDTPKVCCPLTAPVVTSSRVIDDSDMIYDDSMESHRLFYDRFFSHDRFGIRRSGRYDYHRKMYLA